MKNKGTFKKDNMKKRYLCLAESFHIGGPFFRILFDHFLDAGTL